MKKPSLLDPTFRYVPASQTNIRALFAKVRRKLREAEAAKKPASKVTPLKGKKA